LPWSKIADKEFKPVPVKEFSPRVGQADVKPLTIGIEFNQTEIIAALVDEHARVVAERRTETPQRTTRATIAALAKAVLELAASKARENSPIAAIGLSMAGVIDPPTGRVSIPGWKGWTRVALVQALEEHLNDSGHDIRTPASEKRGRAAHAVSAHPAMTINSSAAAIAAAEGWHGAARGKANLIYLGIGTEIETGILINGRPLVGAGGYAGAAGWLALGEHFKGEYGSGGCLSAEATMNSMARRAIEAWDGQGSSMLGGLIKADASQLNTTTVLRAARGGDKLAVKVVNDTCRWIGRGVSNLISILNPEVIVIGGEFGLALKPYLDEIREESRRWAAPEAGRQCRVVNAMVGEKAAVIGAARLAWLKTRN
jgi:glucokinase